MGIRFALDLILIVYALTLPWWMTTLLTVACIGYFRQYYEAVGIGFIMDVVFGAAISTFIGFPFVFTVAYTIAAFSAELLKKRLRWYSRAR